MNPTERAIEAANFKRFARLLSASKLGGVLQRGDAYTVFAPTDDAFENASGASIDALNEDVELMRAVAGYHLAAGKVMSKRFVGARIRAMTHGGQSLIIDGKKGLYVNSARVVQPDIIVGACVLHGIDGVLWPRQPGLAAR